MTRTEPGMLPVRAMRTINRNRSRLAAILFLAVGVAACGGGSDGGGNSIPTAPTTPIAISAANAEPVAGAALGVVSGASASSALIGAASIASSARAAAQSLTRIATDAIVRIWPYLGTGGMTAGAAGSQTFPCVLSGSYTITSDATSIRLSFTNCSDAPGEVVNGALTLSSIAGSPASFSCVVDIDLRLTRPGYADVRVVGGYGFAYTRYGTADWSSSMNGSRLTMANGPRVDVLLDFNLANGFSYGTNVYSSAGNYTLASTSINGAVNVQILSPIETGGNRFYPFAGQLLVGGTGGSKLRLTVWGDETHDGNDVLIEVDADGNDSYETTIEKDWSALPM